MKWIGFAYFFVICNNCWFGGGYHFLRLPSFSSLVCHPPNSVSGVVGVSFYCECHNRCWWRRAMTLLSPLRVCLVFGMFFSLIILSSRSDSCYCVVRAVHCRRRQCPSFRDSICLFSLLVLQWIQVTVVGDEHFHIYRSCNAAAVHSHFNRETFLNQFYTFHQMPEHSHTTRNTFRMFDVLKNAPHKTDDPTIGWKTEYNQRKNTSSYFSHSLSLQHQFNSMFNSFLSIDAALSVLPHTLCVCSETFYCFG